MITIVLSYYENGGMLDRHMMEWASYTPAVKAHLRAIIVDDGSQNDPAAGHIYDVGFPVECYRIKENLVWNIPGARNLGMHVAPDGWCLLTDIDHLLQKDDAEKLIAVLPSLKPGTFYWLAREWADGRGLPPHHNSYVLQRSLYWLVGGTDEDFSGWWGAGEGAFRANLSRVAKHVDLSDVYLTHYGRNDIPDASTREWGRRGSGYDWTTNPALRAKRVPYRPENPLRFEWERAV